MITDEPSGIWGELYKLAQHAATAGEVPVAAAITLDGTIIARAHNLTEQHNNATQHAEMIVIAEACKILLRKSLSECELYVTLEPCTMCAAALSHARIGRIYFGAYDSKAGAVDNGVRFFEQQTCHHAPDIYGGFHEQQFAHLLKTFFAKRRA